MPEFTITAKRPVVVMDVTEYEELLDRIEQLEFLKSKTLKLDVAEARRDLKEGRTVSLAKLRSKLDARRTVQKS